MLDKAGLMPHSPLERLKVEDWEQMIDVNLKDNTPFPFSDLNNLQVADLMSAWLTGKGLDKDPKGK
jgi:hypothetical protein